MIDDKAKITQMQEQLCLISRVEKNIPLIIIDGVYGDETRNCVKEFQCACGIEPTGDVDYETRTKIEESYRNDLFTVTPADSLAVFPGPSHKMCHGDVDDTVYVIQHILRELNCAYDDAFSGVCMTGTYDDATTDAIRTFQHINGLPETGETDKRTWNAMVKSHSVFCYNKSYTG